MDWQAIEECHAHDFYFRLSRLFDWNWREPTSTSRALIINLDLDHPNFLVARRRLDGFSFWRGLIEYAMMSVIPQRMAYLRFGPEGSKDRSGTA